MSDPTHDAAVAPSTNPPTISLEENDALRIENTILKARLAGEDVEKSRAKFAATMRAQAELTAELSAKYEADLTRYDFDAARKCLVLRQPRAVPQAAPPAPEDQE